MPLHCYPKNIFEKLDFNFIKAQLQNLCSGTLGKNGIDNQDFFIDEKLLQQHILGVNEFKNLLLLNAQIPIAGFNQLDFLQKLQIDNYPLEVKEVIQLYFSLKTCKELIEYFTHKDNKELYPNLFELANRYEINNTIIVSIIKIIDIDLELVKDNASIELATIRKQIYSKQQEIHIAFRRALQYAKSKDLLAETEETIRDGKKVLSLKSEHKRVIKGLIIDESNSGNITYIEPNETVILNNLLTELKLDEKREIVKILRKLTAEIKPNYQQILYFQEFLITIDILRAKAYFGINFNCNLVSISKNNQINLLNFVHPVLLAHHKKIKKTTVSNSVFLDKKNRILVISGPNAGGKSVVLKSVGLLQLMFQFGMLLPVDDGSELPIFNQLFLDIGDQQSLENDLSTYSSHLSNMKYFTDNANEKSLVLIDEIGVGTDPSLGGAVAEAILEILHQKNIFGVMTTHYHNLKLFASQTHGIVSGAMAFDMKNLQPLYNLQLGQPGSSFTFEIGKKIGLSNHILQLAQSKTGENKKVLDDTLTEIQIEKQYIKGLRKNVQNRENQLDELVTNYDKLKKDLEKEKKRIAKQYEEKLLEKFNEDSRNLEKLMREFKEDKNNKEKYIETRKYIDENRTKIEQKIEENKVKNIITIDTKLQIGSFVTIEENTEIGQILELKKDIAIIKFGNLTTKIKINRLQKAQPTKNSLVAAQKYTSKSVSEKLSFDSKLDIRGLLKDEALTELESFLDKSFMYGLGKVSILHGKGTGQLRLAVHNYLKTFPHTQKYYHENDQFGGNGITILELK